MPLPTSGAISVSQLATEFGDSVPYSLSEYYRNGSLVPSTKNVPAVDADIGPMSGTNAPKWQGGAVPNNLQVFEGIQNPKGNGSITYSKAAQRTGLSYTTPYAGTLFCLVVGGGGAGSWWGGGIGSAGGGGGAALVSKTVAAGEVYSVTVGGGGRGHGPPSGTGQGGSTSTVTGPGSFSVSGNGSGHSYPYGSGGGGGRSISGSGITTLGQSNGGTGAKGNNQTGGSSGITNLTGLSVAPIRSGDTQIWYYSTRNGNLNNSNAVWQPGSFATSTGSWTFSNTARMGGWGQGGWGNYGDYNGAHGAGGVVIMWMNQIGQSNINQNVPTSGVIALDDFYGGEG